MSRKFQYFRSLFSGVRTVLEGLSVTLVIFFRRKAVTLEYPDVKAVLPQRARMRLFNDVQNCISCRLCAQVCPVDCIYLASEKRDKEEETPRTENNMPMRLKLTQFVIDTSLCCYCGLCADVCPTDSLVHSHDYEYSQQHPNGLKYNYLDPQVISWRNRLLETGELRY